MKPMTNTKARQLTSVPTTHDPAKIRAIAGKAHDVTARIEFLSVEGKKMADLVKNAPGGASSRLDWLHQQLTSI